MNNYLDVIKNVLKGDWKQYSEEPFNVVFTDRFNDGTWVADYDQIKSKRFAPEVDFFRGVIFKNNQILCLPYVRSYNLQEDVNSFKENMSEYQYIIEEKVDGSLIKVYQDENGKWMIATRSTSEANNEIWTDDLLSTVQKTTYKELFLKTAGLTYDQFSDWCNKVAGPEHKDFTGFTFLFELCTKLNKVVIDYPEDCIYFHGISALNRKSKPITVKGMRLRTIPSFMHHKDLPVFYKFIPILASFNGHAFDDHFELIGKIDEALSVFANGKLIEGCMIHKFKYDESTGEIDDEKQFKYKTNQYVIAHKLRGQSGSLNLADATEMYLTNEQHEFLSYFPEYQFIFDNIDLVVKDMVTEVDIIFNKWNSLKNDWTKTEREIKKEFFTLTANHKYFHCIMNKYAHPNNTVLDFLKGLTTNSRTGFFDNLGVKKKNDSTT